VEFKEKNPSKLTGEVVDKLASRPNILLRNPSISAEIISSSWKAERERESVLQAFRIVPSVSCRQTAVRGKIRVAPTPVPCPVRKKAAVVVSFSAEKKMGHHRIEIAL
jgi:hypothetical protein